MTDSQTLTNKILTSPTITSPAITTLFTATGLVKVADLKTTPNFRAQMSGTQLVGSSAEKIAFATEVFDSQTDYDPTTNYRFTPSTAGIYAITASIDFTSLADTANRQALVYIYKNGSEYAIQRSYVSGATSIAGCVVVTCLVSMNGSSDYVEAFGGTTGTEETVTNNNGTFFEGHWVGNAS